ncbi:MAG: hypothetical protein RLZZ455_1153 [Candidatus Parcubacteria bacterium]|jgi:Rrf2 family protein
MIRFSRSEDYAIVIVGTLAKEYLQAKKPIPLSEIAKEYAISLLFLRNLANELREAGVIKALEGKNGGYFLTKHPNEIKMGEILAIFSSKRHLECCPVGGISHRDRICPKEQYCVAGNIWRQLNKEFIDKVYGLSLLEFLQYTPEQNKKMNSQQLRLD